jgi:signal transduction histidine kinase
VLINWLQRHPRLVDWGLLLVALATTLGAAARHDRRAIGIPIALATCLPLLLRRERPLATLATTVAGTVAVLAAWESYNPFPVGVALFTVAERCERRTSLRAGVLTLAVLAVPLSWRAGDAGRGVHFLTELIGFGAAWLIGDSVRSRRAYTQALEERAARLEHERETEAARAVAQEQARIARELHDVIAHSISVIVVQAAAARDVFTSRPDRAAEALASIEATGRRSLAELRRLLGAVRGDTAFAPQPGLDRLDELAEQVRAAGVEVAITVEGRQRALPAALDLSAYRVVQEALTNTLKHANASRADVALRYSPDELDVEIRDDGAGAGDGDGAGSGLIGMRERVGIFGGSMTAGPSPGGGFEVCARFPIVGASA